MCVRQKVCFSSLKVERGMIRGYQWILLSGWWGGPQPVWPDWAIYWTLGNFLKPLATINLPKSPTFFGNFCKGVKIYHFSSEIVFGQLLKTFGDFFWSHWWHHPENELKPNAIVTNNYHIMLKSWFQFETIHPRVSDFESVKTKIKTSCFR